MKKETGVNGIVAVVINGQQIAARFDKVQGMAGASFVFNNKPAFLPVPKEILDEILADERERDATRNEIAKEQAKFDNQLAAFNQMMDQE
ncbi:hypothetical protein POF51_29605 [Brevibacillus sp. AG]|uniref:hypothetical protein n=1 Tax=Brevibacillus sp. AG TaxID=3020891 RepID=UPI00232C7ADF|nr:hypothetical protein [Brevibacillus sp. AG]MDC0764881.1 hypothetical protein [Brevibacillus sp. AG]